MTEAANEVVKEAVNEEIRVSPDNILLAPPRTEYASALFGVIDRNREAFTQVMPWPGFVKQAADTQEFLAKCQRDTAEGNAQTYVILWQQNQQSEPVGVISFNSVDRASGTAWFGYWLDKAMEGRGIVTQSVGKMVEHHASRGIQRFVIKCTVQNTASNKVAQRCGFVHERVLPGAEVLNGVAHDQNMYVLAV